jgi:hypothetical protein
MPVSARAIKTTGDVDLAQHFRFTERRFGVKEPRLGSRKRNADLRCRFL